MRSSFSITKDFLKTTLCYHFCHDFRRVVKGFCQTSSIPLDRQSDKKTSFPALDQMNGERHLLLVRLTRLELATSLVNSGTNLDMKKTKKMNKGVNVANKWTQIQGSIGVLARLKGLRVSHIKTGNL